MQLHPPLITIQKSVVTIWSFINGRDRSTLSALEQAVLYLGLVLGVCLTSSLGLFESNLSQLLSILPALVATPIVYETLRITPETPFWVRFTFFVQQGVCWSLLFTAIAMAG